MPEPASPAPETEAKQSRGFGSYLLWVFVVVMLYVLSSGPAWGLVVTGAMNLKSFDIVYWPLVWAYMHTPLHSALLSYWCWW